MLSGTKRSPAEVIGNVPPAMGEATVHSVAVHAVMAGCKPEYLPVVLGAASLMLRDEFNMNGVQGTMHGVAPLMIVNGPYSGEIGIHGGNGCFGPGFRANASIGRAIRLILNEPGRGHPGRFFHDDFRHAAALYRVRHGELAVSPLGDARLNREDTGRRRT